MRTAQPCKQNERAAAIVVTLFFLVLIAVVVVGFLAIVSTSRTSSEATSSTIFTRTLADSVVALVRAQIASGARSQTAGGDNQIWTSQPGMIRTFGVGGGEGQSYKLYSSANMVTAGLDVGGDIPASTEVGNNAAWEDLNRPALDATGVLHYPIVAPPSRLDAANGVPTDNPATANQEGVQGFGVDETGSPGFNPSQPAGAANNPAPMFVRWIYVLQDGSMVAAQPVSNSPPYSARVPGATRENPIVGRVAFWADDETCKVNINTASEGTFWDVPRANTATERLFSSLQPVINEFQRFPGHPSMTSLSPVLGAWLPTMDYAGKSRYYEIAPRINDRNASGSLDGTLGGTQSLTATMQPIALDQDRLYSTGDELLFSANGTPPSSPSVRNLNPNLDAATTRNLQFFLTSTSRSADLNPFGQPKVTIWPGRPAGATTTAPERLIDLASTIGPRRYSFVRANSRSPTADVTTENTTLLNYLRSLTSQPIPGYPNESFEGKMGVQERDQVLVSVFDFIRSSVPLVEWVGGSSLNFTDVNQGTTLSSPAYQVTPIRISFGGSEYKGFGSFHTLSEVNILFYAYDVPAQAGPPAVPAKRFMQAVILPHFFFPHIGYTAYTPLHYRIQGLDTIQFRVGGTDYPLGPANAQSVINARPWFQRAGLPGAGLGLAPLFINGGAARPFGADSVSQYPFFSAPIEIPLLPPSDPDDPAGKFLVFGSQVPDPDVPGGTEFVGGSITVSILDRFGNNVQNLQVPIPVTENTNPVPATNASTPVLTATSPFFDRINLSGLGNELRRLYYPGDVVVGIGLAPAGPNRGDIRMVAGFADVPASHFSPLPATGPDSRIRTNVRGSRLEEILLVPSGNLVQGLSSYHVNPNFSNDTRNLRSNPHLAPGIDGVTQVSGAPGDWTTSMSNYPDMAGLDYPDSFGSNAAAHFDLQSDSDSGLASGIFYAPNRSMPSPVILGSLPTGLQRQQPWQTLLFSPVSAAAMAGETHPGSLNPPDHLLLELLRMPVVQPYAISDRFSTDGKINLNFQMQPFSHIERATGLHALLKSARIYAVPDASIGTYKLATGRATVSGKTITNPASPSAGEFRLPVDAEETLKGFREKFNAGDVFRTASQLTEMPLVPRGTTWDASGTNIRDFWSDHRLTGDNMRENPYRDLYGRVTVQSNSFTVYYTVQALKKTPTGDPDLWVEGRDVVTGELRGATSIERFIDPLNPDLAARDFATDPAGIRLDDLYQFRVHTNRTFAP